MNKKQKVLRLSDHNLIKIHVQQVFNDDGWMWQRGRLELCPTDNGIVLLRDGAASQRWDVHEHHIGQLPQIKMLDGTARNRSPTMQFLVIGHSDRRHYRHLYYNLATDDVGTRHELGLRYPIHCLSRKQRTETPEAIVRKLIRERRYARRERKIMRDLQRRILELR
jgi:hypothetical protein